MNIQNPYMSAARRSGEPDENAAKVRNYLSRGRDCITEEKKYRLHYNDTPVGMCVIARPMEANAWNKNARAFFAHQCTLGRDKLPILEWKEVGKDSESLVWRVAYKNNGIPMMLLVSAMNKTAAKKEAERMLPITAVIYSAEQDDDIEGAVLAARSSNSDTQGEENDD